MSRALLVDLADHYPLSVIASVSGINASALSNMLYDRRVISERTAARLHLAKRRLLLRQTDAPGPMVGLYRAVLAVVCLQMGLDAGDVQGHDPARRQTANPAWLAGARARRTAQYVLNACLGFSQAEVARASGVTTAAVSLACKEVEAERDDSAAYEQLLTQIERAILGVA